VLCAGGAMSIAQLTSGTQITRQAVTKHLHVLADAGLVRDVKSGRERLWEFELRKLDEARHSLEVNGRWRGRSPGTAAVTRACADAAVCRGGRRHNARARWANTLPGGHRYCRVGPRRALREARGQRADMRQRVAVVGAQRAGGGRPTRDPARTAIPA
jgi:DNA-binding transcriptional ArsR family regulator